MSRHHRRQTLYLSKRCGIPPPPLPSPPPLKSPRNQGQNKNQNPKNLFHFSATFSARPILGPISGTFFLPPISGRTPKRNLLPSRHVPNPISYSRALTGLLMKKHVRRRNRAAEQVEGVLAIHFCKRRPYLQQASSTSQLLL